MGKGVVPPQGEYVLDTSPVTLEVAWSDYNDRQHNSVVYSYFLKAQTIWIMPTCEVTSLKDTSISQNVTTMDTLHACTNT